ncbi:MAG: hypothetical protein M1838_003221 [Thelocarpon superellum]|nr:MAG: hypothetical protein M1838_003221 [Thelocarpon superellum]
MLVSSEFNTLEGRLASFTTTYQAPKRRGSARRGSGLKGQNALTWPHATPSPAQLAKAGFIYAPTPASPDNVYCFLCQKPLDGWEEEDDAVAEHLHHSPDCGWAILMGIEKRREASNLDGEDPASEVMQAARRATFVGKWPHEGKKGWLCKTEKMVESGWYYCPIPESDDFVSCPYCSLSLDGWEPKDKPLEEHQRRSPTCAFFNQPKAPTTRKKGARASRTARASNNTRLSTQSNISILPDAPSLVMTEAGANADEDDSGLTAITVATNTTTTSKGGKKGGRPKKAAAKPKGRKKVLEDVEMVQEPDSMAMAEAGHESEANASTVDTSNGKKRKSEAVEDEVDEASGRSGLAQPSKRRATTTQSRKAEEPAPVRKVSAATKKKKTQAKAKAKAKTPSPVKEATPIPSPAKEATPIPSPARAAIPVLSPLRAATPSPSPSPSPSAQTSDAENQPPSRPLVISPLHRADAFGTPLASSTPAASRANRPVMAEIQLNRAEWMAADLEAVFLASPNGQGVGEAEKGKGGSSALDDAIHSVKGTLTSPEKKMTVEEWITHNADLGEERLRGECERLVGVFEREGNRALQVLDALEVL